jgi:hypothetical protein
MKSFVAPVNNLIHFILLLVALASAAVTRMLSTLIWITVMFTLNVISMTSDGHWCGAKLLFLWYRLESWD